MIFTEGRGMWSQAGLPSITKSEEYRWRSREEHNMFKDWQVALIDWCLEYYRISGCRGCLWGVSVLGLCSVCSEWPNPVNALGWFAQWSWARMLQEEDLESVNSFKSVVKIWKRNWGDRPGRSQKEDFKACQAVLSPKNQLAHTPFVWPTLSLIL